MGFPVGNVFGGNVRSIWYHQQILLVSFFGTLGEVERTSDHNITINNHDFVVSDFVWGIYEYWHFMVLEKCGSRISLGLLALIQDDLDIHSTFVCFNKGSSNQRWRWMSRLGLEWSSLPCWEHSRLHLCIHLLDWSRLEHLIDSVVKHELATMQQEASVTRWP